MRAISPHAKFTVVSEGDKRVIVEGAELPGDVLRPPKVSSMYNTLSAVNRLCQLYSTPLWMKLQQGLRLEKYTDGTWTGATSEQRMM